MNPKKYDDASTEWWHGLADRLKYDNAFGPVFAIKKVQGQLTARKYHILSDGRTKLESKDDMKKRGLKSPDWGDALAMAYAPTGAAALSDEIKNLLKGARLYA
jgi:hypothetical protein